MEERKDNLISQKLKNLDSVMPDIRVLGTARSLLAQKQKADKLKRNRLVGWLSAAAASVLILILGFSFLINSLANIPKDSAAPSTPDAPYYMSSLYRRDATQEEANTALGQTVFTDILSNSDKTYVIYTGKTDNKTAFVHMVTRDFSDNGNTEISIIAEIADGYIDNKSDYMSFVYSEKINGVTVKYKSYTSSGEKVCKAYFEYKGVRYYIDLINPENIDLNAFVEKIIK